MRRTLAVTVLMLASVIGGCDARNLTQPTPVTASPPPPLPAIPVLTGKMTIEASLTATGGYEYTVRLEFKESGGVAAAIKSVALDQSESWREFQPFVVIGAESWSGGNVVPSNGSLTSPPLVARMEMPDAYYDGLVAVVTYADAAATTRTVEVYGTGPPMPEPPPGAQFMLTGTAFDDGMQPLADVIVEVLTGDNAGRHGKTDADGRYRLAGVRTGTFDVGYSKAGYTPVVTTTELKSNRTVDTVLTRH